MCASFEIAMKRGKILCRTPIGLLAWQKGRLGIFNECDCNFEVRVDTRNSVKGRLCSMSRFAERCLRETPRCAVFFDQRVFVAMRGCLVEVNLENGTITESIRFRDGMRSPLGLTVVEGLSGFDDCLAFGDYWDNPNREAAEIHALRRGTSKWFTCAEMPGGTLRHVHAIVPDKINDCVYVLTGDEDSESQFIKFTKNFSKREVVLKGSQNFRSCAAVASNGNLIYATDSPIEKNHLFKFNGKEVISMGILRGSVIYSDFTSNGELIFSTTVEPDSGLKGWKYIVSRKPGPGIDGNCVDVCIANSGGYKVLANFRKDCWPAALCQFGAIEPIVGEQDLYLNCSALKGHDRDVLVIRGYDNV